MDTSTASSQGTQLSLSFLSGVNIRCGMVDTGCIIVRIYINNVNLPYRRHDRQRLAFNLWGTSERKQVMISI